MNSRRGYLHYVKRGDVVKYSKPEDAAEAEFRFVLLNEPQKGRVDIQLIH